MKILAFCLFIFCMEANDLGDRCRQLLKTSLVDFYLQAVDPLGGGYLENWRDGQFVAIGEKSLVIQARHLWFFSTLVLEGIEGEAARKAAQAGYEFLENRLRDRRYGGYFAKVSDEGRPIDRRKHVYLQAFAIYGLVAYYRMSGDLEALAAAQDLFFVLEKRAYDRRHGGYFEFFTENWKLINHRKTDSPVGPGDIKTYNTHLHVMEALTQLFRVWPDSRVRERLAEIVAINTKVIRHATYPFNLNEWNHDWSFVDTPSNLSVHYGHELKGAWLALEAARALKEPLDPYYSLIESSCNYCLQYGYDSTHGGFFFSGPFGQKAQDTKKIWWAQAEALVTLLEMFRLTGKEEYFSAFKQTLDFIERHQIAPGGGWWATRGADGSPMGDQRSSGWQGAYHNGRALLLCAKILEGLL